MVLTDLLLTKTNRTIARTPYIKKLYMQILEGVLSSFFLSGNNFLKLTRLKSDVCVLALAGNGIVFKVS